MSHKVRCRCGWEGDFAGEGGREPHRCPVCDEALPADPMVRVPRRDDGASSAESPANSSTASAPPAVLHEPPVAATAERAGSLELVLGVVRKAWDFFVAAFRFYVECRSVLRTGWRVWINEHMPSFDRPEVIRREIRISLDEQEGVREEAGVWHIDLPTRCVVCGGKPVGGWIVERRTVLDPYGPIVGPLAGLIFGVYLSWWYQSQLWLALSFVAGMLVGYASRKSVQFQLRFMRCSKHAEPGKLPEVVVLHRHLVLRVGARDVKLAFLQRGRDGGPIDETSLPTELMVSPSHEMIALAEDVPPGADIVPEQSERLVAADDENGSPRPPAGPDEYRLAR